MLRRYECYIPNYFEYGHDLSYEVISESHSKARYQFYRKISECVTSYAAVFKFIKVKSLGKAAKPYILGDKTKFTTVCMQRGIDFAHQGMTIDVAGQKGVIIGGNDSSNFDVYLHDDKQIHNVHPTWETTYYDKEMKIVKEFKII